MPASKRGTEESLDPQAKSRRLDDDGEALQSETAPAINNISLKEIHTHEMMDAVAPRTKRKLSEEVAAATEGNPAKSSRQSTPISSILGTPIAKHTSASCWEAPSDNVSAEFNVDNMPGNGSKDGLFTESDEPSCIKKYSSRVQNKLGSDSTQVSDELASAPTEFVQNDHSYGRASDSSPNSILDATEKNTKEMLHFEGATVDIKFTAEEEDRKEAEGQKPTANHPQASSLTKSNSATAAAIRSQSLRTFCSSNGDVHLETFVHGPNCQTDSSCESRETILSVIKQDFTQNTDLEKHEMTAGDALMRINYVCGEDPLPLTTIGEEIVLESCNPQTSSEENRTSKSNKSPDTLLPESDCDRNPGSQFKELLTSTSESQTKENPTVEDPDSNLDSHVEKVTRYYRNPSSEIEDSFTIAVESNSDRCTEENQGSLADENVASAEPDKKPMGQIELECRGTPTGLAESLSKEANVVPEEVLQGNYIAESSVQKILIDPSDETVDAMESALNPTSHVKANLIGAESERNPDSPTEDISILKETVPTSQEVLIERLNANDDLKASRSPADDNRTERGQSGIIFIDLSILKKKVPTSQEVLVRSLDAQIEETHIESSVQENLIVGCCSQPETKKYISENQSLSTEPTPREVLVDQLTAVSQVKDFGETLKSRTEEINAISMVSDIKPINLVEDNILASPSLSQETEEVFRDSFNAKRWVQEKRMESESQILPNSSEEKQEQFPNSRDGINKITEVLTPHCEVASEQNRTMKMPRDYVIVSQQQTDVEKSSEGRLNAASLQEEINKEPSQNVDDTANKDMMSRNSSSLEKENICFEHSAPAINKMNTTASAVSENVHPAYSSKIDPSNNNEQNNHSDMNLGIDGCLQNEDEMNENITEDSNISNAEMVRDANVQESPEVSDHTTDVTQKGFLPENFKNSGIEEHITVTEKPEEAHKGDVNPNYHMYDCGSKINFDSVATTVSPPDHQIQSSEDLVNPPDESENQVVQAEIDVHPTIDTPSKAVLEENQEEAKILNALENRAEVSENIAHEDSLFQEHQTTLPSETSSETQHLEGQMVETSHLERHETELPHELCQDATRNHSNEDATKNHKDASLLCSDPAGTDKKQEVAEHALEVCEVQTGPDFTAIDNKDSIQCVTEVEMVEEEEDEHMEDSESTIIVSISQNNEFSEIITSSSNAAVNQEELDVAVAPDSVLIPASTEETQVQNADSLCVISEVQLKHVIPETAHTFNAVSVVQADGLAKLAAVDSGNPGLDHYVLCESDHSSLEEEKRWQDEDTTAKTVSNHDSESAEVQVVVFAPAADTATIPTTSEEQSEAVTQSQAENQIVYEPISSPESNGDADTVMAMEKQCLVSFEDISGMQDMEEPLSTNECMEVSHLQLENEAMATEERAGGQRAVEMVKLPPSTIFPQTDADREAATPLEMQNLVSSGDMSITQSMEELFARMKACPLQLQNKTATEQLREDQAAVEMEDVQRAATFSECDGDEATALEKEALVSLQEAPSTQDKQDVTANESVDDSHLRLERDESAKEEETDGKAAVEMEEQQTTIVPESSLVGNKDGEAAVASEKQYFVSSEDVPITQDMKEHLSPNESIKDSHYNLDNTSATKEQPTDTQTALEMEDVELTTTVPERNADAATDLEKQDFVSLESAPSTQDRKDDMLANESTEVSHLGLENDKRVKEGQTDSNATVEMEAQQATIVPESNGDTTIDLEKRDLLSFEEVESTQVTAVILTNEGARASYYQLESDESLKEEQTGVQLNAAVEMEIHLNTIVQENSSDRNKDGKVAVALENQELLSPEDLPSNQEMEQDLSPNESIETSPLQLENEKGSEKERTDIPAVVEMEEEQTTTNSETRQESNQARDVVSDLEKQDLLSSDMKGDLQLENEETAEEVQTNCQAAVEIGMQETATVPETSPHRNQDGGGAMVLMNQDLVSSEDVSSNQEMEDLSPNESIETSCLQLENEKAAEKEGTDIHAVVEMEEEQTTPISETRPESNQARDVADVKKQDLLSSDMKGDLQLENEETAEEVQTNCQAAVEIGVQETATVPETSPHRNQDGGGAMVLMNQDLVSSEDVSSNQEMDDLSPNESIETSCLQLENEKAAEKEGTDIHAVVEMEEEQTTPISETHPESNQARDVADVKKQDLLSSDMKSDLQLENEETAEEEQTNIQAVVEIGVQETATVPEISPQRNQDGGGAMLWLNQDLVSSEDVSSNQEMDDLSPNESTDTSHLQLENKKAAEKELTVIQAVVEMEEEQTTIISETSPESKQVGEVVAGVEKQDLVSSDMKSDLQLQNKETAEEEQTNCQAAVQIGVQETATVPETSPQRNRDEGGGAALDKQDFVPIGALSRTQDMKDDLQLEKEGTPSERLTKAAVEVMELQQTSTVPESSTPSAAMINSPNDFARKDKSVSTECAVVAEVSEHLQDDLPVKTPLAFPAADIPDDASEEYVILEPVPENKIHLDIVSQAAVASGLSDPCLVTQVDPKSTITAPNGPQQTCILKAEEPTPEVKVAAGTPSGEEAKGLCAPPSKELTELPSDNLLQPSSLMIETDNSQGKDIVATEDSGGDVALQELQILEDMEIGHEIVVVEVGNVENNDITIIDKVATQAPSPQKALERTENEDVSKTNNSSLKPDVDSKVLLEKPKKQEMNTQARTKARLAALAEQKAAAMKKTANRQQLNLLALCQEIAEDIATDSMLLKRIEEEKQAVAKGEAAKKENPSVSAHEVAPLDLKPQAEPESFSAQVPPVEEPPAVQPPSVESKMAVDPPKRRFFVSQVSVPLKAHEKKKLTRYQRLRQVELQREKMSWARMKKMKSDQANQMFSDMDWQASMFTPVQFTINATTTDPAPKASSSSLPSPPLSSKSASPKPEDPESQKSESAKTEAPKVDASKTEPESKTQPAKIQTPPTEPAKVEITRVTRQSSKAQTAKVTPPPTPTPKVTRSSARRSLPAVPPPMPNGLKASKPQPVEYKPYKPRPRYSPDDFELDDDPLPVPPKRSGPLPRPGQPRSQSNPLAQSNATPQLASQAKLQPSSTLAGQIPGQSKPTISTSAQSKPTCSPAPQRLIAPTGQSNASATSAPAKSSPSDAVLQSKPDSAVTESHQALSVLPQLKTAGPASAQTNLPVASNMSQVKPCGPPSDGVPGLAKTRQVEASTDKECKGTPASSSPTKSPPPSEESSNPPDLQQCEGKPAVADQCQKTDDTSKTAQVDHASETSDQDGAAKQQDGETLQREVKKLDEADKDDSQTSDDAGQKHFGAVACSVCGMLYSAANPEDESQHLLFHNQFICAVKYVGWKKERILGEFPDGKIILVLPDDPKYALKKVEEIREMVDNDLGFQQVGTKSPALTKTFLFITNDKKVAGCLIAEHINEGYRVIEEPEPEGSEGEKVMFERQRAWCCSTTAEPALCGISRIWVVSMMRRQAIASRLVECLRWVKFISQAHQKPLRVNLTRNNFIYGSYLSKDEIAFSDPTPDGKLFATHYFGTSQFLVYNFVSSTHSQQPKADSV